MPKLSSFVLRKFSRRVNGEWKHYPCQGLSFTILQTSDSCMTITIQLKGTTIEKASFNGINMRLELYPKSPRLGYKMVDEDTERVMARFQTCFTSSKDFQRFLQTISPMMGVQVVCGESNKDPQENPIQNSQMPNYSQPSQAPYYQGPSQCVPSQMPPASWNYLSAQPPVPWTYPPCYPHPIMTPPFSQPIDAGHYGHNGYSQMKAIEDGKTNRTPYINMGGSGQDFPMNDDAQHEIFDFSRRNIDALLDILESSDCFESVKPILDSRNFVRLVDKIEQIWRV